MQIHRNPPPMTWESILKRPAMDVQDLAGKVREIMSTVKTRGDYALREYTARFDGVEMTDLLVSDQEITDAELWLSINLKESILLAKENIEKFHRSQLPGIEKMEVMPGVDCWRKAVPIQKVGLYIPGGTAPLFSTILMLGIPAMIAGCREIVLCSPPGKDGKLDPAILFTAGILGIKSIFKVGGVQAIAAMTYGTESVPKVYKIFGPGNQYVTAAKQFAQQEGIAIDMPAGPSEVAVLADENADASFIAADLLSQAEHGVDSQVLLVSTSEELITAVDEEIENQLAVLPRKEFAAVALRSSKAILVESLEEGMAILNEYAPEHLIINTANAAEMAEQVVNAGSVFLGPYSPESVGDYASGTNHTLPTNGFAKAYSGVSVDSFLKKITFQQLTREGLENIGPAVQEMAMAEGLQAHASAVAIRLEN